MMLMGCFCVFLCVCVWFFSDFFVKGYVVGTHLNCINFDKSMQFKWVPTTYVFIKK